MASHASIRRPGVPYNYETPEQKARDVLRGQKTIARVTTNADQRVQSVAALQALAKATGVPEKELPAGGIHSGMSPADVQAATDRINRWRATQQQGAASGGAAPAQTAAPINPDATNYQVAPVAQAPQAPASPAPQTRTTPTGGTETLVSSESGPRWVASVSNAPAPNNMNGQISRDPGGRTVQVQQAPIALRPTRPGQPVASVAQNLDFYRNPTQAVGTAPPVAKPWQPAPGDYAYATNGGKQAPVAAAPAAKPWQPPVAPAVPITPPAVPAPPMTPATGAIAGGVKGGLAAPAPIASSSAIPGMVKDPSSPSGYTGVPASSAPPAPPAPVNPATSPSRGSALNQPFNPDDDDSEEAKRRLAAATGRPPAPTSKPYQF